MFAKTTLKNVEPIRHETLNEGWIMGPHVMGRWSVDNWSPPTGFGHVTLRLLRNGNWLERFAAWFDREHCSVETSREILVRKGIEDTDKMISDARKLMAQECKLFALRNLIERGYTFEAACTMLNGSAQVAGAEDDAEGEAQDITP